MTQRMTPQDAGCIFAGSCARTADELNAAVVLFALDKGWTPFGADDLRELAESVDGWVDDIDASQFLSDYTRSAHDWLDEHVAPEGHFFTFDDGFYLFHATDEEIALGLA